MHRLILVIEVVNLVLGIQTLIEKSGEGKHEEKVLAILGVLEYSADVAEAYGALRGWSKRTLAGLGAIAGAIESVRATIEAEEMAEVGDTGPAVGYGLVAAGSALAVVGYAVTFFSSFFVVEAELISFGPLGIIAAVMVAIGYIIVWRTTSSPLQLFVAHSVWGDRYGEDHGEKPWSSGPFESWHESKSDGLARQVAAMTNLLAAFEYSFESSMVLPKNWTGK